MKYGQRMAPALPAKLFRQSSFFVGEGKQCVVTNGVWARCVTMSKCRREGKSNVQNWSRVGKRVALSCMAWVAVSMRRKSKKVRLGPEI